MIASSGSISLILCRGSHSQVASLRKRARSKPRWARKLGRAPEGLATQLGSFQFKGRLENHSAADSPDNDGFGAGRAVPNAKLSDREGSTAATGHARALLQRPPN